MFERLRGKCTLISHMTVRPRKRGDFTRGEPEPHKQSNKVPSVDRACVPTAVQEKSDHPGTPRADEKGFKRH